MIFINMKKYIIPESFYKKYILKESEDILELTPDEYMIYLKYVDGNGDLLTNTSKFKGKKIVITSTLKLSSLGKKLTSLGPILHINGGLDIQGTRISDLGDIEVKGYVSDWGTPLKARREAAIQRAKANEMDEYRESDDWNLYNPDIDDLGLKANALFEYLVGNGDLESLSNKEKERVDELRSQIDELETQRQNLTTDDEDWNEKDDELQEQIGDLQQELDDLVDDKSDVYVLYPDGGHYGLQKFENLSSKDEEYSVGTEDEMDDAVLDYTKSYIDDVGIEAFQQSEIEDYIDIDDLVSYFEDSWRDDIYENPDAYFNDDDFELTPEQEKRISEIEIEIEDYENQQSELDSDREDYDELYDDFQDLIDKLESEKDEIVPDTEPTDEMIENVLEDRLNDVKRNPMFYLRDYGMAITDFIDKDGLAKGLADDGGYGIMNSYNGEYDTIDIKGETYYIMRLN